MIGHLNLQNNDLLVFYEGTEVEEQERITISGELYTQDWSGGLEVSVVELKGENFKTELDRERNIMKVEMRKVKYEELKERGRCGEHQSWRHISLIDSNKSREGLAYSTLVGRRERKAEE